MSLKALTRFGLLVRLIEIKRETHTLKNRDYMKIKVWGNTLIENLNWSD